MSHVLDSTIAREVTHIRICLDSIVSGRSCLRIGGHCVSGFWRKCSLRGLNAITPSLRAVDFDDRAEFPDRDWRKKEGGGGARPMTI